MSGVHLTRDPLERVGQCTCNVTVWRVRVTIVTMETQQYVPFCIVVGVDVGVSMTKVLIVAMETQQHVPFCIVVCVDVGVSMTKMLIVAMEMQQWILFSLLSNHIFHTAVDSNKY